MTWNADVGSHRSYPRPPTCTMVKSRSASNFLALSNSCFMCFIIPVSGLKHHSRHNRDHKMVREQHLMSSKRSQAHWANECIHTVITKAKKRDKRRWAGMSEKALWKGEMGPKKWDGLGKQRRKWRRGRKLSISRASMGCNAYGSCRGKCDLCCVRKNRTHSNSQEN